MTHQTSSKNTGNGAYISVARDMLHEMGAEIGTEVTVEVSAGRMTVAKGDSLAERARRSAEKTGARQARTLDLIGG